MLPSTLALVLATQMTLVPRPVAKPPLERYCGTRAVWDAGTQSCRALPPTRQQCWADGQQLDPARKTCVPVNLSAFCREHNWDFEQEHTISRILNDLNAHDCDEAEQILQKTHRLTLNGSGVLKVQDLRPLRALPYLEELQLDGHRVSDLEPLQKLQRLRKLSLRYNNVYDLQPLLSLPYLESLDLAGNPIDVNDPALKKLQKRMKVNLQAPADAAGEGSGLIMDAD